MARKLKVYAAEIDGLHEWIVAAPNQTEALAALGVNQNLFQQGLARSTDDPAAIRAAEACPGVALRRLKGSKAAFRPGQADTGEAWARAAKAAGVSARRKKPRRDRSRLDAAGAALEAFEAEAEAEQDRLNDEIEALERRRQALINQKAQDRVRLTKALESARRAYDG